ncbi:hypothetical protein EVAR_83509_1 [Eumeta japonica]|uniref:Uncharacterized protein n=1 Tax=Eumeta variegata TaxID=151549 RepID=A0A4C1XYT4_EUMVA|nr:hypothetical protein EVAR_83509_1 [Eumeta japonica]
METIKINNAFVSNLYVGANAVRRLTREQDWNRVHGGYSVISRYKRCGNGFYIYASEAAGEKVHYEGCSLTVCARAYQALPSRAFQSAGASFRVETREVSFVFSVVSSGAHSPRDRSVIV